MDGTKHEILIAGGGIGGLTAAIALKQRGHQVEVFERAPELKPLGAGITLQINAMRAYAKLGLAEKLAAAGAIVRHGAIVNWDGEDISDMDLAPISEELGAPCVGIHRAELHRVLVEAFGQASLHLGREVKSFTQDADGVTVTSSDGSTARGDALIACDGIHSAVRAQLHGASEPEYAGYTSWRGVCANDGIAPPDAVAEAWGDASRFGMVPIGHGRLYWFAVADAPAGQHDGPDPKAELQARFKGWYRAVERAIEATPSSAIIRVDVSDRPVMKKWGEGRVTLLGDAAHPMTPNLGQGACMAIEDGIVLASAFSEKQQVADALRLYESRRMERTAHVVETARKFGKMGQWSSAFARAVRNALVHHTPKFMSERQVRWLYEFEP